MVKTFIWPELDPSNFSPRQFSKNCAFWGLGAPSFKGVLSHFWLIFGAWWDQKPFQDPWTWT